MPEAVLSIPEPPEEEEREGGKKISREEGREAGEGEKRDEGLKRATV